MICPNCGKEIADNATFCGFCGMTIAANQGVPMQGGYPQQGAPMGAPMQGAPMGAPMQGAPMGAPMQGAPMGAPMQGAPMGAPMQGAPMGAPMQGAPMGAPMQGAPMGAPMQGAPMGAPMQGAPMQGGYPQQPPMQGGYPQQGYPMQGGYPQQPRQGGGLAALPPKTLDLINLMLRGSLAVLGLLCVIGGIATMATIGAGNSGNYMAALKLPGAVNLARIPAIIAFVLSCGGAVLAYLTKSRSLIPYIAAGAGLILFVFNFVEVGFSSLNLMIKQSGTGAATLASIFMLIGGLALIGTSVLVFLKKDKTMLLMKKPLGK